MMYWIEKMDKMKCINCRSLNNLETISEEEMRNYIEIHEYRIEDEGDNE